MIFWEKWGKDSLCGITHTRLRPGRYKNGTKRCVFLSCKHGFYTRPLLYWIQTCYINNKIPLCPICRNTIDMSLIYLCL